MEIPTEEQLRYHVQRQTIGNSTKWCMFLLQCFPTKENIEFVNMVLARFNKSWQLRLQRKVLTGMLQAKPLSQKHIDLALSYGPLRVREKATRIATRLYEI